MPISDIIMSSLTQAGENISRGIRHAGALRENKFWSDQAEIKRKANTESDREYEKQLHNDRLKEQIELDKERLKTSNREYYRKQALAEAKAAMATIEELDATGKSYFKDVAATRRELEDKMAQIRSDNFDPEDFDPVPDSFHAGIREYKGEQARAATLKASVDMAHKRAETAKLLADAEDHKGERYAIFDGEIYSTKELDDMAKAVSGQTVMEKDEMGNSKEVLPEDKVNERNRILQAKIGALPYDQLQRKAAAVTPSGGLGPLAPQYVKQYLPAGVPEQGGGLPPLSGQSIDPTLAPSLASQSAPGRSLLRPDVTIGDIGSAVGVGKAESAIKSVLNYSPLSAGKRKRGDVLSLPPIGIPKGSVADGVAEDGRTIYRTLDGRLVASKLGSLHGQ